MSEDVNYHMTPEAFRQYGRAVVDWIADYYQQIEDYPVLSQVQPGEIRAALPTEPPQRPIEAPLRQKGLCPRLRSRSRLLVC